MIPIIEEGDKSKQGNAVCPQCRERVLLDGHWGDPPKCPKCNVIYDITPPSTNWRFR